MILYGYYPPNGHHFSSEEKNRIEEKGLYLPEEEQSRISSFANVMKGYGLEIKDIKISSMKLPPMIQEAIDKKAIESVQGFQEIANAQTFAAINKIMEGTADDKNTQAILAALAQGLEGINLNVITSTGNQGSSGIDGIVAALMNKNKGGES